MLAHPVSTEQKYETLCLKILQNFLLLRMKTRSFYGGYEVKETKNCKKEKRKHNESKSLLDP